MSVSWWTGADSCFPGLGSMIAWWRLLVASIHFHFSGLGTEVAWWKLLVAWVHFLVPSIWFHGCTMKVPGCLGLFLGSLVARWRFLDAWVHFLFPYTCLNDCLVKVLGCLNSVPGSLGLVPWLPDENYQFLRFTSCFSRLGSIIAWWKSIDAWAHFLVPCTWLPGFGSWLPGFGSWFPWLGSLGCPGGGSLVSYSCIRSPLLRSCWQLFLVAWSRFLVPWSWFPSHYRLPVVAINHSWHRSSNCTVKHDEWWCFLVGRSWFLLPWTWFHDCMVKITGGFDSLPLLWPWYRGCLVEVTGCLGSLPGSQYLVPWLHNESHWLPGVASWFPACL